MRLRRRLAAWLGTTPLAGKMGRDVIWNVGSVAVLSVVGLLFNILIGRFYGASMLGVFNQVYAVYIILSQLSAGGLHYSVLKHASHEENQREWSALVTTAALATLLLGAIVAAIAYAIRSPLGSVLGSADVGISMTYVVMALPFFALNKVLLALLNARRHMRAYALYQALRFILMLASLVALIGLHKPGTMTPLLLTAGEIALSLTLIPYVLRMVRPAPLSMWWRWLAIHLRFGSRALLSGVFTEVNTRIDVLMLGLFASDSVVGVYSVAAFITEGLFQLPVILRTNLNPVLAKHYHTGQTDELLSLIARGVRTFYWILGIAFAAAMIAYPIVAILFMGGGEFIASWPAFCILSTGIIASAGYLPYMMLLVQTGHPGAHTLLILATVFTNATLNAILIPFFGLLGAALATGVTFFMSVIYLRHAVRRLTGLTI